MPVGTLRPAGRNARRWPGILGVGSVILRPSPGIHLRTMDTLYLVRRRRSQVPRSIRFRSLWQLSQATQQTLTFPPFW